ncbi:hypothetical protein DXB25_02645 [Lachnospiraceae bacterium OM02-31]|nr:hypothetical protein DXB25_02645 [Lachnospiraceae bacterium OM02-31]RJW58041.1 hypothetical protein DXB24_07945 [Lachnospiraceae bacterium OM02-3]
MECYMSGFLYFLFHFPPPFLPFFSVIGFLRKCNIWEYSCSRCLQYRQRPYNFSFGILIIEFRVHNNGLFSLYSMNRRISGLQPAAPHGNPDFPGRPQLGGIGAW